MEDLEYFFEFLVFIASCYFLYKFFRRWYSPLSAWPDEKNRLAKIILGWLPVVFLILILLTLLNLASFDVVDNSFYILFYILLGYAWMYGGLLLVSICFDLHWFDDAVYLNNKAAMAAITGEFIVLALIYAGSNIGDGPGWWCVIFAGSLGLFTWIILGFIVHYFTGIFERITVDRDLGSGIRFLAYSLASGFFLGNACSGDWTSFSATVVEFAVGWPVLPLTAVIIFLELLFKPHVNTRNNW